jgi:hypothetical protein
MAARLGDYWFGCIVALVTGAAALYAVANPTQGTGSILPVIVIFGVVAWLIGRACRYVLAGK